jgi:GrpB-like predicted nucleotidyltransferase (UPF0157 family)
VSGTVVLVDYDPSWPTRFETARAELLAVLNPAPILIEHMGSTAVPGLMAKPVIDIIVQVADMQPIHDSIPTLASLGYEFRPAISMPERLFLRRYGAEGTRAFHLHVHTDASDVKRHLIFRDLLRADDRLRRDYLALKTSLADQFRSEPHAYANAKNHFVDAAVLAAGGPARAAFWNP